MQTSRQPAALDWFVVILLATIWGASFIMIKRSVEIFTPVQMAMWRMVLATLVYLPIAAAYWSKIDWKRWKPMLVVAFCGSAIPNFLFAVAQQHVNSSLAGILNALTPLFTVIIGASFFQMQVNWARILGIVVGLSGAVLLVLFNRGMDTSGNVFFAGLCILATVCYAINANTVGRYLRDQHPAAIASSAFVITGGLFVIGLLYAGGWAAVWQHPNGIKGLGYVFYLAAMGTVGGSILYFWLLQRTSPIFATSVTYLLPVTAIALGFFDGESVSPVELLGTGIILTGLYLARK
jgi:drug/metabolite transporter (DMT)-like permease